MKLANALRRYARKVPRYAELLTLSPVARTVRQQGLTYLSPAKMKRLERTLSNVMSRGVKGDVLEFGIALGGSSIVLAQHALKAGRQFHGFDVFGMIPPPTSDKDGEKSRNRYRDIAERKSAGINGASYYGYRDDLYGEVCISFAGHGMPVDGERVRLHKGLFEDTVPQAGLRAVAFAHIDCDWYDPVRYCLMAIAEKIAAGGAIILDDYNDYDGCKAATDEFVAARPDFSFERGPNVILRKRH